MISETNILQALKESFLNSKEEYKLHKKRAIKAFRWWKDNLVPGQDNLDNGIAGTKVKYNGVDCLVVASDLRGCPNFMAEFELMPLNIESDAGSGAGERHKLKF